MAVSKKMRLFIIIGSPVFMMEIKLYRIRKWWVFICIFFRVIVHARKQHPSTNRHTQTDARINPDFFLTSKQTFEHEFVKDHTFANVQKEPKDIIRQ